MSPVDPNRLNAQEVNGLHRRSDLDSSKTAQHHTLGATRNQAACGNHNHRGEDSALIFDGITLTGSTGGNVALQNLITALVAFGLEDSTT
jgi:hypothetical protein